jgi:hypothetical protein
MHNRWSYEELRYRRRGGENKLQGVPWRMDRSQRRRQEHVGAVKS